MSFESEMDAKASQFWIRLLSVRSVFVGTLYFGALMILGVGFWRAALISAVAYACIVNLVTPRAIVAGAGALFFLSAANLAGVTLPEVKRAFVELAAIAQI